MNWARLRTLLGVGLMAALLVLYLVVAGQQAVLFVRSGEPVAVAIGVALAILPILGAWALGRELLFGYRAHQLAQRLPPEASDDGTEDELPRRPSGRPDRAAADARFPRFKEAVEQEPENWRAWFRLGVAYDDAGDRRRARQAVRQAIALERRQRA